MTEQNFKLTVPSGKVYEVRRLPKHFFLFYGELPQALSAKAVAAVKAGKMDEFEREVEATLTPEQIMQSLIFMREAVKFICVNPKISMSPQNDREISPFEITEEDFNFLGKFAMSGAGGREAEGLEKFRGGRKKAAANRADGA